MHRMVGNLAVDGRTLASGGFMHAGLGPTGFIPGESQPIGIARGFSPETNALLERLATVERTEVTGDMSQILAALGTSMKEFERAITSTTANLPVRENLEAVAKVLIPGDTPVRNFLPRVPGAGTATQWRQITSLGGGWITQTDGSLDQPGGSAQAVRAFFSESGAPAEHVTSYANVSKGYKLLGTYGSVTGFAMASGANFQNQLAMEKTNALRNLMLNEEYALIAGSSTSTAAPWGDGQSALSFDGMLNLIATANGVPTTQVQASVGPLSLSHIDNQLKRIWVQGGQEQYILMNATDVLSLVHLAEAAGSIIRISAVDAEAPLGLKVTGYKHPITGQLVPIMVSRFLPAGTILFGSKYLPDGSPAMDISVLPQVQLPQLAVNENIAGYVAQELAPTTAAPQVYAFIVSVYEVLRMKGATVFAKSTGVTAV